MSLAFGLVVSAVWSPDVPQVARLARRAGTVVLLGIGVSQTGNGFAAIESMLSASAAAVG